MAGTNFEVTIREKKAVEECKSNIQQPPRYKVIMHNDDYTPMSFVVEVLQKFFALSHEQANELMLEVHYKGQALCGIFTREVAETKIWQVSEYARSCQHPLRCSMNVET